MFRTFLLVGASAMALAATSAEALTFVYTGTIQHYTVATTGIYNVVAAGASGGNSNNSIGGFDVVIGAHISLTAGTLLDIIVGGAGGSGYGYGGGGGGGSFVLAAMASPIVIAGGGGGGGFLGGDGAYATSSQNGTNGGFSNIGTSGSGGSGGAGGQGGSTAYLYDGTIVGLNGGGGGGLHAAGSDGHYRHSGSGGSGAPGFAGGLGSDGVNFGGGGFGGGGGFSGGGGGGSVIIGGQSYLGGSGGGGGGSFTRVDASDVTLDHQDYGNGLVSIDLISATPGVPEPATWGLLTGGFGMIGAAMRRGGQRKARAA